MAKKPKASYNLIIANKKARFEYHLHEQFEAGLALKGWEVKSLRAGRVQLADSYVQVDKGEAFLHGCNITPLSSASSHTDTNPTRNRKLLLHKREISRLIGATQQKGQTCVALSLHWKGPHVKCNIALATGKQSHDKRASIKDRDWQRDKQRFMKAR